MKMLNKKERETIIDLLRVLKDVDYDVIYDSPNKSVLLKIENKKFKFIDDLGNIDIEGFKYFVFKEASIRNTLEMGKIFMSLENIGNGLIDRIKVDK